MGYIFNKEHASCIRHRAGEEASSTVEILVLRIIFHKKMSKISYEWGFLKLLTLSLSDKLKIFIIYYAYVCKMRGEIFKFISNIEHRYIVKRV